MFQTSHAGDDCASPPLPPAPDRRSGIHSRDHRPIDGEAGYPHAPLRQPLGERIATRVLGRLE
ncbi:MAG: hypothetical protein U5L11_10440 [Arhodomonas sp.]|nr:hypothetical protein [Arhodomonas sp.]